MHTDRILFKKKLTELVEVAPFFKKISGIDITNIPEKYGDDVLDAQKILCEHAEIAILYKCNNILSMTKTEVVLEDGIKYTGKMPPRILKDSKQVITCVITLCGFTELLSQNYDMMIEYFLDAWGSSYVECAQAWLGKHLKEELAKEGLCRTHLWSPGQHQFELQNQKTVFAILNPEDVGCTLTKNLMMVPVKSGSGIWGIIENGVENVLLPCDFCSFSSTCPASKKGCAEI